MFYKNLYKEFYELFKRRDYIESQGGKYNLHQPMYLNERYPSYNYFSSYYLTWESVYKSYINKDQSLSEALNNLHSSDKYSRYTTQFDTGISEGLWLKPLKKSDILYEFRDSHLKFDNLFYSNTNQSPREYLLIRREKEQEENSFYFYLYQNPFYGFKGNWKTNESYIPIAKLDKENLEIIKTGWDLVHNLISKYIPINQKIGENRVFKLFTKPTWISSKQPVQLGYINRILEHENCLVVKRNLKSVSNENSVLIKTYPYQSNYNLNELVHKNSAFITNRQDLPFLEVDTIKDPLEYEYKFLNISYKNKSYKILDSTINSYPLSPPCYLNAKLPFFRLNKLDDSIKPLRNWYEVPLSLSNNYTLDGTRSLDKINPDSILFLNDVEAIGSKYIHKRLKLIFKGLNQILRDNGYSNSHLNTSLKGILIYLLPGLINIHKSNQIVYEPRLCFCFYMRVKDSDWSEFSRKGNSSYIRKVTSFIKEGFNYNIQTNIDQTIFDILKGPYMTFEQYKERPVLFTSFMTFFDGHQVCRD